MSGWAMSASMLSGLTLPPYRMRTPSAASPKRSRMRRAAERHRLLRLLGRGRDAGADGPDGLVGDGDVGQLGGVDLGEVGVELAAHLALRLAGLALLERLAAAEDGPQAGVERRADLLGQVGVVLVVVLPALGVAEDHVGHAELGRAWPARSHR